MSLSDAALARLAEIVDAPDLAGTKYELRGRVGRGGMGTVWRAYDRELGRELGLPVTQVTNHLAAMRRELRREVLDALRALTASDEEFRAEARDLLGVVAP